MSSPPSATIPVKEMDGDYGLKYCIPLRGRPSREFFSVNEMAGVNTFDEVMRVAMLKEPPFPVAKAEKELWTWVYWRNYGYLVGGGLAGGGLGYISAPRVGATHFINVERMMVHSRSFFSLAGVALAGLTMDYFDVDGHYDMTASALESRTPLGDFTRVTFEKELQKDLGTLSVISGSMQIGSQAMDTVHRAYDANVPGSIRNLFSNV
eukprot:TRINITY_DN5547_c4_g1_i1.p1 TRINITY_DN5547_c4_g1~~TRINITY_DN5547_c4_g1_i1.p1  ORF type:complete len:227 (+),score=29.57 TRINITY_DN5547_c4_g1_i1:60-683(+)